MADPITWYALGRTVVDTETIMEAVDEIILNHNLDPSAHGQENESVYEHRANEILDHVNYSIYNLKINPANRVFKAIVANGLEGDFVTIQSAIDWANLYGGGIVYIKAGTYTLTNDLILYSNIELQGEDDDTSIIDLNYSGKSILISGTSGLHKTNIRLRNLCITHAGLEVQALFSSYADDVLIEDCKFLDNYDPAYSTGQDIVLWTGVNRFYINRTRFLNGGQSISFG